MKPSKKKYMLLLLSALCLGATGCVDNLRTHAYGQHETQIKLSHTTLSHDQELQTVDSTSKGELLLQIESVLGPRLVSFEGEKLATLEVVVSLTFDPTKISTSFINSLLSHPSFHMPGYGIQFVSFIDSAGTYFPNEKFSEIGYGFNPYPHSRGQVSIHGPTFPNPVIRVFAEHEAVAAFSTTIFIHEGEYESLQNITLQLNEGSFEQLIESDEELAHNGLIPKFHYGSMVSLKVLPDDKFNWLLSR